MWNFYFKASLWKLFQEGQPSETPEACTSGSIHTGIFIPTLEGALDGQRLNKTSNAQLGTGVPRQEVSHKALMPNMPTSPLSVTFRGTRRVYVGLYCIVCVCVHVHLGGAVEKPSQQGGPCSRPGSSSKLALRYQEAAFLSLTVGLVAHSQDDLGGAVVAGDHIGRHKEAGGSCPGEAKIQDLQCAVGLHHNVAWLQVL